MTEAERAYYALLDRWDEADTKMRYYKQLEMDLRQQLFEATFSAPVEGTNKLKLIDGTLITGKHVINRKVDEALLSSLAEQHKDLPVAELVKYKPELSVKPYRALTVEQRQIFDSALIISVGSPQLSVERPIKEPT